MPFVNVKLVGKLTKPQKEQIAKEISETLFKVAGKKKETTYLAFEEFAGENWAVGEKLLG
jgi:4-oxalocrotonate tautomerase